ncbi:MAG: hypothetical protein FWD58_02555 [Firmicutes bacterium]|nr:hypothetical protein [Bacillota bacterium]
MDWSLLIGIAAGCVTTIIGGIGFELIKGWMEKKGKIDIYYMSDSECYGGARIIIRLQVKNLTQSDYIMRDIRLVEIDEEEKATKTYKQKQKVEQILKGCRYTLDKIYGEDGEFSFVIKQKSIQSMSLTYDKERHVESIKIKCDGNEIDTEQVSFSAVNSNLAIQYYDEDDDLIVIRIKPKQEDWVKAATVER